MLDPNFNPYDTLIDLQHQMIKCLENQQKLAKNNEQRVELVQQLVENVNRLIEAVNQQDLQIQNLHGRLTLLEVARQYDNTKRNETN